MSAHALHEDVYASVQQTLRREARRTELAIASVRLFSMLLLTALEVWLQVAVYEAQGLSTHAPLFLAGTILYTSLAFFVWWWIKTGHPIQSLSFALPLLDLGYLWARLQLTVSTLDPALLIEVQTLATVVLAIALVMTSSALRLQRGIVLVTTLAGLFVYGWFASAFPLSPQMWVTHIGLLLGMSGLCVYVSSVAERTLNAEVGRTALARLLPGQVLNEAYADPVRLLTEPRTTTATVLMTDIRGFTRWSQHREPTEVLAFLNTFHAAMSAVVVRHGGSIDKYIGDGMLAGFGALEPLEDHPQRAVDAAREMLDAIAALNAERGGDPVGIGIGIHTGPIIAGCVGGGATLEFTMLGDTVNTASRLEAMTKVLKVSVVISDTTAAACSGSLVHVEDVSLRGREGTLPVYTL